VTKAGHYLLTIVCDDVAGIVAAVGEFLFRHHGFIVESQQHSDPATGRFFMRLAFRAAGPGMGTLAEIRAAFRDLGARFGMSWSIDPADARPRVLVAVSKAGHCLNDLIYLSSTGALPIELVGVVSNHPTLAGMAAGAGLPFLHLPIAPGARDAQERALLDHVAERRADLLVLARYMQVLSPAATRALRWRCINIHHSFLPSFKGARPYHQAYDKGVKIIGATAHFITDDLDEGPIIEQDVERVDHAKSPEQLVAIGADIEARVLARAVRLVAERRVLPNGHKTVVFA